MNARTLNSSPYMYSLPQQLQPRWGVGKACGESVGKVSKTKIMLCNSQSDSNTQAQTTATCSRRAVLAASSTGISCGFLGLSPVKAEGRGAKYNLESAKARGEEARETKSEQETPGELIVKESGLKYREILTGNKGQPAVPGALCEIRYTVYRLSSGAYFKESSGGKPVYMWSLGYGKEGKNDLEALYRFKLGEPDALPPAVAPAVVGMRQGGVRRVLVPPRFGWAANDKLQPVPDTYGASRRLSNHKMEPLLFEVELVRVGLPGGLEDTIDAMDLDAAAAAMLPERYNQAVNRPPPSALSYNSIVYRAKK
eukprot:CAMPEP_0198207686 /NCGR_PEP_ID=MMETSP1445-20131203/11119_1 /TAXON_ID=36898 /ORGANISM="Pyramimonas sp., Strain CCMP2087" /LENGTH=310 /DNA_ID=CAMNT_0043880811 /DNA_START=133 /DNA_END=1068 /DNA_ORIENTATION=-